MFDFIVDKHMFVLYNISNKTHVRNICSIDILYTRTYLEVIIMYNRRKGLSIKNLNPSIKFKNTNISLKIVLLVFIFAIILLTGLYINNAKVLADNPSNRTKQVISIKIEKGDTLWDIANNYITEDYNDIIDYIDEIKFSNGLYTDTIHEGRYLIVPYYADVTDN